MRACQLFAQLNEGWIEFGGDTLACESLFEGGGPIPTGITAKMTSDPNE